MSEEGDKQKIKMYHIEFDISEGGIKVLQHIREAFNYINNADVWRAAIVLAELIVDRIKKGDQIFFINQSGAIESMLEVFKDKTQINSPQSYVDTEIFNLIKNIIEKGR